MRQYNIPATIFIGTDQQNPRQASKQKIYQLRWINAASQAVYSPVVYNWPKGKAP